MFNCSNLWRHKAEQGSALVYILIAIALLAVLTVTFMEPSSQQTSSQNTFRTVTAIASQISQIRASMEECVLSYPKGDHDITAAGTDSGARTNYPINPGSDYYDGPPAAVIDKTPDRLVRNMRCPGNQDGPNPVDHALIFSGKGGKYLPPAPDLFTDWQIYNGTDGVFFWTATSKSDAFLKAALDKLDEQYAECEVDTIDATGGAEDLVSDDNTITCANGDLCFRVWVIANSTALYQAGSVEASGAPPLCP